MHNKDFAVFILSHGRPDRVYTLAWLARNAYSGATFIVCDKRDPTLPMYCSRFKNIVKIFDKSLIGPTFDIGDNFESDRSVVYARNAVFDIAKSMGLKYFLVLDDDYIGVEYKINQDSHYPKGHFICHQPLDVVFDLYLDFFKSIQARVIAMAQTGDFQAKLKNINGFGMSRKCMNSFFCAVDRPFQYVARMNDDVTTYVWRQSRGELFLTVPFMAIKQLQTQSNPGGLTEMYLDSGTYVKSFYTVMFAPSCVKIAFMGAVHRRLHHRIDWEHAVPKIVPESCRKASRKIPGGSP